MAKHRTVDGMLDDVGELLQEHAGEASVDLSDWRDDPVALAVEIGRDPVEFQADVLRSVVENRFTVWRGCHSCGKEHVAGTLALWGAAVREMLVLVISATEGQVVGQTMGEVGDAFASAARRFGLGYKRFRRSIRLDGEDRVLALTGSADVDALTGWHDPNGVLVLISEGQGERLQDVAYDAALGNANTQRCRVWAGGNPVRPTGRFYEINHSPSWETFATSAFDTPNVVAGQTVLPGFPAPDWPEEMEAQYGGESPFYVGRVLGEFPDQAAHGLISRSWLEEAGKRWARLQKAGEVEGRTPVQAGLDPSRLGADATVLAVARGEVLDELVALEGRHTATEVVRWASSALKGRGIRPRVRGLRQRDALGRPERVGEQRATGRVVVDEPGLGGPILDRLQELRFRTRGFNGGKKAGDPERFFNARAEAYWSLARRLEDGEVALPPDDRLVEELASVEYTLTGKGRVQIEAKDDLKSRIGRSPDRADAAVLALSSKPKNKKKPKAKVFGPSNERSRPKARP